MGSDTIGHRIYWHRSFPLDETAHRRVAKLQTASNCLIMQKSQSKWRIVMIGWNYIFRISSLWYPLTIQNPDFIVMYWQMYTNIQAGGTTFSFLLKLQVTGCSTKCCLFIRISMCSNQSRTRHDIDTTIGLANENRENSQNSNQSVRSNEEMHFQAQNNLMSEQGTFTIEAALINFSRSLVNRQGKDGTSVSRSVWLLQN